MRIFWELTKTSLQRHLTYRAATIAGLVTNFFFGILRAAIFVALYDQQAEVGGLSLQGAITFAALAQAFIGYLSLFSWFELMNSVYTGDISSDLLKPMNYFAFWLAQDLGRALVNLLLRGLVLMAGYALIFDLIWPKSILQMLAVLVAIAFSWLLSFAWRFLINLSALWTPNARGILRFFFVFSWFFSGFLMPLRLYPDWVQSISRFTPFPHMLNSVVEIYLNMLSGPEVLLTLLAQLLWATILIAAGQFVLRAGVRRLVILGG
ncbi:MAG: ABC-2 family transporter protein [Anaerolineae bacterium]|nr:ABC-2 family transporter protein [Anaerolineae bacterium]